MFLFQEVEMELRCLTDKFYLQALVCLNQQYRRVSLPLKQAMVILKAGIQLTPTLQRG